MSTEIKVVMFTDQVRSTSNMARRTRSEIEKVASEQDQLTLEAVNRCRGKILKDTGDGHIIEFPSCSDAVRCGFIIQQGVRQRNASQEDAHLAFELHVGIDFGEALVLPTGDLRANTANLAARVCSECPPGEVYVTEKVKREISDREASLIPVGLFSLKGTKKVRLYRLTKWLTHGETASNPFIFRDAILESSEFFDRDSETRRLKDYLRKRAKCQIVGPRRTGKTSFLLQIKSLGPIWSSRAVVAYLDLYNNRHATLRGWLESASKQLNLTKTPSSIGEFAEGITHMLQAGQHPIYASINSNNSQLAQKSSHPSFIRTCGPSALRVCQSLQLP